MFFHLRIDERLIHGQIAAAWGKALNPDAIVCASDAAVKDSIRTKMLLMAAPVGVKVRIRGIDDAIRMLADPRVDKMKILLITDTPDSAVRLVKELNISAVNVANFHSKGNPGERMTSVIDTCVANDEDLAKLNELAELTTDLFSQKIPSNEKIDLKSFFRTKNA